MLKKITKRKMSIMKKNKTLSKAEDYYEEEQDTQKGRRIDQMRLGYKVE